MDYTALQDPFRGELQLQQLEQNKLEKLQLPQRYSKPCSEHEKDQLIEMENDQILSEHQMTFCEAQNPFKQAGESNGTVSEAVSAYTAYLENRQSQDYQALKTSIVEFQAQLNKIEDEELLSGYDWGSEDEPNCDNLTDL